jgi:hypothetical protein
VDILWWMPLVRRALLPFGVLVVAVAAYMLWYLYGPWPVPDGYTFPRHSIWGSGPGALYEGSLVDDGGCIRTVNGTPATVIWPPGYTLTTENGQPVVHGDYRDVHMGEAVRMGGGWDEDGPPPPWTRDPGECLGPWFFTTGWN